MYTIRKLKPEEYRQITEIASIAFPEIKMISDKDKEDFVNRMLEGDRDNPRTRLLGVFDGNQMVGGMRYNDFRMRMLSLDIDLGGIGFLVVDFMNKKRGVAKAIIQDFFQTYERNGAAMVALYPFRPDFYKKMGFGYGTSMSQFQVQPQTFPKSDARMPMCFLDQEDASEMVDCYERFRTASNGLFEKHPSDFERYFKRDEYNVVGYRRDGILRGYLVFEFVPVDPHRAAGDDLKTIECVYEDPDALLALTSFFHSQLDQVSRVIVHTQDPAFKFLLDDVRTRNSSVFFPFFHESDVQGTGIMYRVIHTARLFEQLADHDFAGETLKVGITVRDSLYPSNDGRTVVVFESGRPVNGAGSAEVEVEMEVAEFSSLITCSVDLKSLVRLGRATVSDLEYLERLNRIFSTAEKPLCMTRF